MDDTPLQPGETGVLQNLRRSGLNGLIAEVTGELRERMLYSINNPADSEICLSYRVRIPGYPPASNRIEWCVKQHQLRRIDDPDGREVQEVERMVNRTVSSIWLLVSGKKCNNKVFLTRD